jgi:hypothetical protein
VAGRERTLRLVVEGVDKSGGKTLNDVNKHAHHLSSGLKTLGLAAGVAFAAIGIGAVRGIAQATKSFQDHQKVVKQTAAVLTSTGHASNQTVKGITRLSDALERKTTVDGDVIQSGANMIATFTGIRNSVGKGNDIFNQATATVLDMSVALGQDTKNSAIQLGKALNDPIKGVTALQRVGVTFTEGQKKQIKTLVDHGHKLQAQKIILAELNKEFGGSAAAAATPMGKLAVLGRQLSDVVGGAVLPAFNTLTSGLLKKFGPALSEIGDRQGPKVAKFLNHLAHVLVASIPSARELTLGVSALGAAFSGEGITTSSDKFVGKMERIGVAGRKVVDFFHTARLGLIAFGAAFSGEGITTESGTLVGTMERLGVAARGFIDKMRTLKPQLAQAGPSLTQAAVGGHAFGSSLTIIGPILDVVARNLHNILPFLPAIVAGFLAFRAVKTVLGPISDLGTAVRNFATPALVIATFAQAKAQRALATATREQGASSLLAAGEQEASNAAGKVGLLTSIRARVAIIAQAVAQKVVAAATKAWAAVQWLVNAALTANPIGVVIIAIAALAAGIIYAYRHSETFRKVVQTAFAAIKVAVGAAVTFIIKNFRFWFDVASTVVLGILHMFGKLPGPLGAPFRAAEAAVRKAKTTVDTQLDKIQTRVGKLHGKDIPVTASLKLNFSKSFTQKDWAVVKTSAAMERRAKGGVTPLGKTTLVGEEGPELVRFTQPGWIYTAGQTRGLMRGGRATGGPIGQIDSEARAVNKVQAWGTGRRMDSGLTALMKKFSAEIPSGGGAGSALAMKVAQWTISALRRPLGEVAAWFRRLMFESGGNPRAINRTDSNWVAGHPSVGIAQVIRGTFAGNAGRFRNTGPFAYGVSMNPYANSFAGAHYAIGRYGSLFAVDPRMRHAGYDRGGWLQPGMTMAYNGTGRPEPVGLDSDDLANKIAAALIRALRAEPPVVRVDDIHAGFKRKQSRTGGISLGLT